MIAQIFLYFHLFLFHPLHLSVSDVVYKPENKSLEITQRLFSDDLEDALRHHSGKKTDVLNPANAEQLSALIGDYLSENFELQLNGQTVQPNYLGYEIEGEAVWVYLEVSNVKRIRQIGVRNTIFFELFDDQVNLINIEKEGAIRSLKLTPEQRFDKLSY